MIPVDKDNNVNHRKVLPAHTLQQSPQPFSLSLSISLLKHYTISPSIGSEQTSQGKDPGIQHDLTSSLCLDIPRYILRASLCVHLFF